MSCPLYPCPTCPWRKSSTVGGFDIPGFNIERMRGLTNTVPPRGSSEDDFYVIMACHYSPPENETACIGYLAVMGYSNLAVRISAMKGNFDLPAIVDVGRTLDLWPDFYTMLDAYEAAHEQETA